MSAHLSALPDMPGDFPQQVREDLVARGDVRLRVSTILLAPDYYDTAIMDDRDDQRHAGWRLGDWVINSGSRRRDTLAEATRMHDVALTAAWAADPTPPLARVQERTARERIERLGDERWPDETWAELDAALAAFREEVIAEVAVADTRVLASVRPSEQRDADRIAELQARLEQFEALTPQQCPMGLHADWAVDSENVHACPWCLIAELRGVKADLEDRLAARLIEAEARTPWSAAADVAEDVASRERHRNRLVQAEGADTVAKALRDKGGDGRD